MAIPTVAFDASKHVLSGRETAEGRELFFTLESIVAAEQPLERALEGPRPEVSPEQLADLEQRLVTLLSNNIPPPQMTAEVMASLADATKAIVSLSARVSKVEAAFEKIMSIRPEEVA